MNGFGFVVLPFTVKHNTLGDFFAYNIKASFDVFFFFFWRAGGGGEGGALSGF